MLVPLGRFISRHVYNDKLKTVHKIESMSCVAFVDVSKGTEENAGKSWKVRIVSKKGWICKVIDISPIRIHRTQKKPTLLRHSSKSTTATSIFVSSPLTMHNERQSSRLSRHDRFLVIACITLTVSKVRFHPFPSCSRLKPIIDTDFPPSRSRSTIRPSFHRAHDTPGLPRASGTYKRHAHALRSWYGRRNEHALCSGAFRGTDTPRQARCTLGGTFQRKCVGGLAGCGG